MTPWPPWLTGSPSSGRTRPARIDRPAASAEVQPRCGRCWSSCPRRFPGRRAICRRRSRWAAMPGRTRRRCCCPRPRRSGASRRDCRRRPWGRSGSRLRARRLAGIGHGQEVALVGIGVDDDRHLGRAVAVDDVVGDAVEVAAGVGSPGRSRDGAGRRRSALTMLLMMAAELAATGAVAICWFQGLSAGNSSCPNRASNERSSSTSNLRILRCFLARFLTFDCRN